MHPKLNINAVINQSGLFVVGLLGKRGVGFFLLLCQAHKIKCQFPPQPFPLDQNAVALVGLIRSSSYLEVSFLAFRKIKVASAF